jgi:hypothetical protein
VVEVDATSHTEGAQGGLIFGYQDASNFYYLRVSDGYYTLEKLQDETWSSLIEWTQHPAILGGLETNKLMVLRKGSAIWIYINSRVVGHTEDNTFASGQVAIAAASGETVDATVYLDNLRLWKPQ